MTTSMNPMYYLKHAWDSTHSAWGKLTIVLFYVYIWLMIISSFVFMVWPNLMGGCSWEKESDYATASIVALQRTGNSCALGFYLYADRGGIRFWNVTMVFVISLINLWFAWTWARDWKTMEGAPKHCSDHGLTTQILVAAVWITVSWVFSFLEHRAGHSRGTGATTNESTPLTA
jgi:hypothetical protein